MGIRRVVAGDPNDRRLEMIEAALLHKRGQLRAEARGPRRLVQDDAAAGLPDRLLDRRDVDGDDGAKVDHLGVDPLRLGGRDRDMDHGPVSEDGDRLAGPRHPGEGDGGDQGGAQGAPVVRHGLPPC